MTAVGQCWSAGSACLICANPTGMVRNRPTLLMPHSCARNKPTRSINTWADRRGPPGCREVEAPLPPRERGWGEGTVAQSTSRRRILIRRCAPPSPIGEAKAADLQILAAHTHQSGIDTHIEPRRRKIWLPTCSRAAARRCSLSQRNYLPRSSTSSGSMRTSNQFIPQCRCGPVARPVAPTAAITWPCSTRSPTLTSIRDRCRKLELMPKP